MVEATSSVSPDAALGGSNWLKKHIRTSSKMHKGIKGDDKIQFFQQLTTLFAAGTPLLEALHIAAHQSQSVKMQSVVRTIADRVAGGLSLHQAAANFPNVFDQQWIEVIKTGEMSSQLTDVLTSLTEHIVLAREMRSKLISAMIYPCILTIVAILAVTVMLWKVVPTFAKFFEDFDAKLPGITEKVIELSKFLQSNGLVLLGGVVGFVFVFRWYAHTDGGKRLLDRLVLTAPLIGDIAVQSAMERFASNAALLLRSGLPLLETLESMQGVFHNNTVYSEAFRKIQQRVAAGGGLAPAMEQSGLFTSLVVSMTRVGEESGQLVTVLDEISSYYRKKVEAALERLTSAIEPIVILGMGVIVATILMSIYLPMFEMAGSVH